MYALSGLLIIIFALALLWALFHQMDQDGVEQLGVRCLSNTQQHMIMATHESGLTTFLTTRYSKDIVESQLTWDEQLSSYMLTIPSHCKGTFSARVEALKALGNNTISRPGHEHKLTHDMMIVKAFITGTLGEIYTEHSKDQIDQAHQNLLTHFDLI
ncbi:hypothetical protein [Vibrio phage phiKT1028]|nr:hypothetical protein [Vibrio phage phiKT1028]